MKLRTDLIRTDGGTQMRVGPYNEEALKDYQEVIESQGALPALTVFQEGSTFWLADGFHRLRAYKNLNVKEVEADVREGTKRDAILFAVGANASHGLRRSNADKRRAVETLLKDQEWRGWTDREIARRSATSAPLVGRIRSDLTVNSYSDGQTAEPAESERMFTTKHGTQATMQTGNIGKRPAEAVAPAQEVQQQAASVAPERQPVVDMAVVEPKPSNVSQPPIEPIPQLPPDYRPGADPNIPPRVDALRKALDGLLRFDKDGKELLDHRGANLMSLKVMAYHAHEMLGEWLRSEPSKQEIEKTITVEALN